MMNHEPEKDKAQDKMETKGSNLQDGSIHGYARELHPFVAAKIGQTRGHVKKRHQPHPGADHGLGF